ncbi:hypothetical protein HZH68_002560 [Vespula germanica]|uniref:Uncharacterized protein n=1 Tax=Vespula germanica TaxID=30212 RepID=A0A834U0W2_VESGE|nr:hypothetical protein HZH68_002560 [Vespula germanica]
MEDSGEHERPSSKAIDRFKGIFRRRAVADGDSECSGGDCDGTAPDFLSLEERATTIKRLRKVKSSLAKGKKPFEVSERKQEKGRRRRTTTMGGGGGVQRSIDSKIQSPNRRVYVTKNSTIGRTVKIAGPEGRFLWSRDVARSVTLLHQEQV